MERLHAIDHRESCSHIVRFRQPGDLPGGPVIPRFVEVGEVFETVEQFERFRLVAEILRQLRRVELSERGVVLLARFRVRLPGHLHEGVDVFQVLRRVFDGQAIVQGIEPVAEQAVREGDVRRDHIGGLFLVAGAGHEEHVVELRHEAYLAVAEDVEVRDGVDRDTAFERAVHVDLGFDESLEHQDEVR